MVKERQQLWRSIERVLPDLDEDDLRFVRHDKARIVPYVCSEKGCQAGAVAKERSRWRCPEHRSRPEVSRDSTPKETPG